MSPEALLEQFGYLAVFAGVFLEGEAILIAAGFFAARGFLDQGGVLTIAFTGAYAGQLFWFWLGRTHGIRLLDRFPRLGSHLGKGIRVFERYGTTAILLTQWLYGVRITCAVIIGMSRVSIVRFAIYQALSCMLWALLWSSAGFYFGRAIQRFTHQLPHLEWIGLALVLLAVGAILVAHRRKEKRAAGAADHTAE